MRIAAFVVALAALAARAQNACEECRNAALAQSAICHQAALHPDDGVECTAKLHAAREKCQAQACATESEARLYALCPDCAKLEGASRERCEKNFCPPPQPKKK